ncbi:MAG: hypothetical protein JRF54_15255 [Deltaproteobacteria bacterium]|nr:hypothetical protein [Deltaproteobacteria bacterium]
MRVLFSTVGDVHCPVCGERLIAHSVAEVVQEALRLAEGTRFSVLAPVVRAGSDIPQSFIADLRGKGFVRLRVDDSAVDLEDVGTLPTGVSIDVVIDRLSVREGIGSRLAEAVELGYQLSDGVVELREQEGTGHASIPKVSPQLFSFNTPLGACTRCDGLGRTRRFTEELAITDPSLSLRRGAVSAWGKPNLAYSRSMLEKIGGAGVDLDAPFEKLPAKQRRVALEGGGGFEGILPGLERRAQEYARRKMAEGGDEERVLEFLDEELGQFARMETCRDCGGSRLNEDARSVRVDGRAISEVSALDLSALAEWLAGIRVSQQREAAVRPLLQSIGDRLAFLQQVGLGYLSLDRSAATMSAGEAQRVRLATQLGARLSGVLYVLDEPTAGLHPSDATQLLTTLDTLRELGNTLVVVEHDEQTMRAADHLVEMGPGAGEHGGHVVAKGDIETFLANEESLTGAYLSGRRSIAVPEQRREGASSVRVRVAELHNLRDVHAEFPLRCLCAVTGVSGSGKSSLIVDALLPAVRAKLGLSSSMPHRSDAARARIRPRISACSDPCESFSPACPRRARVATVPAVSASTLKVADARLAKARASSGSPCNFCPTQRSNASSVVAAATTTRPYRSVIAD